MDKINHWHLNRSGVVYDDEEVSTLNLVGKVTQKTNEVIEELNKKVSHGEDFKGSWWGINKPTLANETIGAVVDELDKKAIKKNEPRNINPSPLFNYVFPYHETSGETWGMSQGMCYAEGNLVIATRPRNNGVYNADDTRTKFKVIDANTGTLLRESILTTHYSNSLYYNENTREILTFSHENLFIIDYDTLTIKNTIKLSTDLIFSGVFVKDDIIHLATLSGVYKMTIEGNVTLVTPFTPSFTKNPQSVTFHDGYYYATNFFPNTISVYDLEGNLVNQFTIAYNIIGMNLTEIEDICFNGDDIYINFNTGYIGEDVINIVKTSLGGKCFYEGGITTYINSMSNTIYVNQNYNGAKVGGTQDYPYKSLNEALSMSKAIYGGCTIVINGDSTFKNVRFNNCNITISCNSSNNIVFENPIFNGGNIEIIRGTIKSSNGNMNIALCNMKLVSTSLETTTGNNINIDSAIVTMRNVIDKLASGGKVICNGSTILGMGDNNSIANKITKNSREVTILNEGLITVDKINNGTIATLPQNISNIIVEMTVADNYKIQAEIKNPVNNLTYSFNYKVDTGGGYDTYIVNFTYQNNVLSFQKNMRFIELNTGVKTREDVASATDKTMYPKVTSIYFK